MTRLRECPCDDDGICGGDEVGNDGTVYIHENDEL
jgi:hypothetical protein